MGRAQAELDGTVEGFPDITGHRYSDELKDWIHELRVYYRTISEALEDELEAREAVEMPWILGEQTRLWDLKRRLDSGSIERRTGKHVTDTEPLPEDANELDALGAVSVQYPGDKVKPVELGRIVLERDQAQVGVKEKDFELWYDVEPAVYIWAEKNLEQASWRPTLPQKSSQAATVHRQVRFPMTSTRRMNCWKAW